MITVVYGDFSASAVSSSRKTWKLGKKNDLSSGLHHELHVTNQLFLLIGFSGENPK